MSEDRKTFPELAWLLSLVERRYGRGIHTSTDFESLSVTIEHESGEYVSAATLKRLWGYVSLKPAPRVATLDVLCRYVGYASFDDFRRQMKDDPAFVSGFFSTKVVSSSELDPGAAVVMGWKPNRLVSLLYLGEGRYRVQRSENAKLLPGDEFEVSHFLLGYPLFVGAILRDGTLTPSYVAGKVDGLNLLELKESLK